MTIQINILIGAVWTDITEYVVADSIVKEDNINEQKDTLRFRILNQTGLPTIEAGTQVELKVDGTREFLGWLNRIDTSIQGGVLLVYDIICTDCSVCLGRKLVLESYENKTVNYIINDIVTKYASVYGFTATDYVNCPIVIDIISFNRITIPECLEKLAQLTGYSWYNDYDRKIHFFPKNENPAPFEITDTNGKYINGTLKLSNDLNQIKNVVTIRGGEEEGIERTESQVADGEMVTFATKNKFASMPTVVVNGSTSSVGLDYVTKENDADCFWNYNEKYVRFKDTTKPSVGQVVQFIGIPLFPVIVQVTNPSSIALYNAFEFFKEDKTIKSRAEAIRYALVELDSYKEGIVEGSFDTNSSGLASGQLLTINSTILGVNESFLIQRVSFRVLAKDKGIWSITLATLRTVGMIQVLQDLLRAKNNRDTDPENLLAVFSFQDVAGATDLVGTPSYTLGNSYVFATKVNPTDQEGIFNFSTYA